MTHEANEKSEERRAKQGGSNNCTCVKTIKADEGEISGQNGGNKSINEST
jgi:hypothetical protein